MYCRLPFLLLFTFVSLTSFAQEAKKKRIELLNAEVLEYDESLGHKARRLLGNVIFEHEGAVMNCDSAYLYEDNSMDAFSKVSINKGDSIKMWCDELNYNGNTEFAKAKRNVKLVDREMTLTSQKLDYNMATEQAWYTTGGKIVDSENTLTSRVGYYFRYGGNVLQRQRKAGKSTIHALLRYTTLQCKNRSGFLPWTYHNYQ